MSPFSMSFLFGFEDTKLQIPSFFWIYGMILILIRNMAINPLSRNLLDMLFVEKRPLLKNFLSLYLGF